MASLRDPLFGLDNAPDAQWQAADIEAARPNSLRRGWEAGRIGAERNALAIDEFAAQAAGDNQRANTLRMQNDALGQAQARVAPEVQRVEDINWEPGKALNWFGGAVGQGLASMAEPVAAATALGGIGRVAGMLPGPAGKIGRAIGTVGAPAAAFGINQRQMAGEFANTAMQDQELMARTSPQDLYQTANLYGAGAGLLDTALPGVIGHQLTGGALRAGMKAAGAGMGPAVKTGLGMLGEGTTEYLQGKGSQLVQGTLNPNRDTSGDASDDLNNFAGGMAGGGPLIAAGAYADAGYRRVGRTAEQIGTKTGEMVDLAKEKYDGSALQGGVDKAVAAGKQKAGDMVDLLDHVRGDDGKISLTKMADLAESARDGANELVQRYKVSAEERDLLNLNPPADVASDPEKHSAWFADASDKRTQLVADRLNDMAEADPKAAELFDRLTSTEDYEQQQTIADEAAQHILQTNEIEQLATRADRAAAAMGELASKGASAIGKSAVSAGKAAMNFGKAVFDGAAGEMRKKNAQGEDYAAKGYEAWQERTGRAATDRVVQGAKNSPAAAQAKRRGDLFGGMLATETQAALNKRGYTGKRADAIVSLMQDVGYDLAHMSSRGGPKGANAALTIARTADTMRTALGPRAEAVAGELQALADPKSAKMFEQLRVAIETSRTPYGQKQLQQMRAAAANQLMAILPTEDMQELLRSEAAGGKLTRSWLLEMVEGLANGQESPELREALTKKFGETALSGMLAVVGDSLPAPTKLMKGTVNDGGVQGEAGVNDDGEYEAEQATDFDKRQSEKKAEKGSGPKVYGFARTGGQSLRGSTDRRDPFAPIAKMTAKQKAEFEETNERRMAEGLEPLVGAPIKRPGLFKLDDPLSGDTEAELVPDGKGGMRRPTKLEHKLAQMAKATQQYEDDEDSGHRVDKQSALDVMKDLGFQPAKVLSIYRDYMLQDAGNENLPAGERMAARTAAGVANRAVLDTMDQKDGKSAGLRLNAGERKKITQTAEAYFKERYVAVAEKLSDAVPNRIEPTELLNMGRAGAKVVEYARGQGDMQYQVLDEANLITFQSDLLKTKDRGLHIKADTLVNWVRTQRTRTEETGDEDGQSSKDANQAYLDDLMEGIAAVVDSGMVDTNKVYNPKTKKHEERMAATRINAKGEYEPFLADAPTKERGRKDGSTVAVPVYPKSSPNGVPASLRLVTKHYWQLVSDQGARGDKRIGEELVDPQGSRYQNAVRRDQNRNEEYFVVDDLEGLEPEPTYSTTREAKHPSVGTAGRGRTTTYAERPTYTGGEEMTPTQLAAERKLAADQLAEERKIRAERSEAAGAAAGETPAKRDARRARLAESERDRERERLRRPLGAVRAVGTADAKTSGDKATPLDFYPKQKRGAVPDEFADQQFRSKSGPSVYDPLPTEHMMSAPGKAKDRAGPIIQALRGEIGTQEEGLNMIVSRIKAAETASTKDGAAGGLQYLYPAAAALQPGLVDAIGTFKGSVPEMDSHLKMLRGQIFRILRDGVPKADWNTGKVSIEPVSMRHQLAITKLLMGKHADKVTAQTVKDVIAKRAAETETGLDYFPVGETPELKDITNKRLSVGTVGPEREGWPQYQTRDKDTRSDRERFEDTEARTDGQTDLFRETYDRTKHEPAFPAEYARTRKYADQFDGDADEMNVAIARKSGQLNNTKLQTIANLAQKARESAAKAKAAPEVAATQAPKSQSKPSGVANKPFGTYENPIIGDLWGQDGVKVVSTNLGGIHGRGLAKQAKDMGRITSANRDFDSSPKGDVITLAVKGRAPETAKVHGRAFSEQVAGGNIDLLKSELRKLIRHARTNRDTDFFLPYVGLGFGEGDPAVIGPILAATAQEPNIHLIAKDNATVDKYAASFAPGVRRDATTRQGGAADWSDTGARKLNAQSASVAGVIGTSREIMRSLGFKSAPEQFSDVAAKLLSDPAQNPDKFIAQSAEGLSHLLMEGKSGEQIREMLGKGPWFPVRAKITARFVQEGMKRGDALVASYREITRMALAAELVARSEAEKSFVGRVKQMAKDFVSRFKEMTASAEFADLVRNNLNDLIAKAKGPIDLKADYKKVSFQEAVDGDPQAARVLAHMSKNPNIAITGSIVLADNGAIYRDAANMLHDLDFIVQGTKEAAEAHLRAAFPGAVQIYDFTTSKVKVDTFLVPPAGAKIVNIVREYGEKGKVLSFEVVRNGEVIGRTWNDKYGGHKSGDAGTFVDLFTGSPQLPVASIPFTTGGEKHSIRAVAPGGIFAEKLSMGRSKDLNDYLWFEPVNGRKLNAQGAGPQWLYHGTRADTEALIDAQGSLVLKPSKNFGGKTNGVSFTHDLDSARDYATRIKGGGPQGFSYKGAKILKIARDALPNVEEEAMAEWADYTGEDVVIPFGKYSIEPIRREKHYFGDSHLAANFREWFRDSYSANEQEEILQLDDWEGEYQERYLEEIVDLQDEYPRADVEEAKAILRDQFGHMSAEEKARKIAELRAQGLIAPKLNAQTDWSDTGARKLSAMSTEIHNDLQRGGFAATHDSPIRHEGKFNWRAYTGLGEGNAAFGAGTYLSTGDKVHAFYKKMMSNKTEQLRDLVHSVIGTGPVTAEGKAYALEEARNKVAEYKRLLAESLYPPDAQEYRQGIEEWSQIERQISRAKIGVPFDMETKSPTYHVSVGIMKAQLLNWDKPLSEQSSFVQRKLREVGFGASPGKIESLEWTHDDSVEASTAQTPNGIQVVISTDFGFGGFDVFVGGSLVGNAKNFKLAERLALDTLAGDQNPTGATTYKDLTQRLGSQAAASDYLQSLGILGHEYAASNGRDGKTPNYVIYDDSKITTNYVHFNRQGGNSRVATQAEMDEAKAYVRKVLGPQIKVEFKDITGYSGEWLDAQQAIEISTTAAAGVLSTAYHEALHGFFSKFVKSDPRVLETLKSLAENEKILARVAALLADHPAAIDQLKSGEERLAYIYQFWAAGKLDLPIGKPRTLLQKVRKFFRRVLGLVKDSERAVALFEAFHGGQLAEPSAAGKVIANILGEGTGVLKARRKLDGLTQWLAAKTMPAETILATSESKAAQALAKEFFTNPGEEAAGGEAEGYLNARRRVAARYNNTFAQAIKGLSDRDMTQVAQYLQAEAELSDIPYAPHREAVAKIRGLLQRFYKYMSDERGLELGHAGEKYYPRVWNTALLHEKKDDFLKMLTTHYDAVLEQGAQGSKGKLSKDQVADRIWRALIDREGVNDKLDAQRQDGVLAPFFASKENRTLAWLQGEHAEPFLEKNLVATLSRYFHQGVRAAEYTERFGADGEILEAKLREIMGELNELSVKKMQRKEFKDDAARAKWVSRQYRDVAEAVGAMEGTLGKDISPGWRKANSWMTVYQNVRLLPLSLFASFVDPLGMVARGATMREAYEAFLRGMKEVVTNWGDLFREEPKERQADKWEKLAEHVGAVDAALFAHHVSDEYSSVYMERGAKTINDTMFKLNGMEAWNRGMRVAGVKSAVAFIERHAAGADKIHSERWLKELGLDPKNIPLDADGHLITDKSVLMQQKGVGKSQAEREIDAVHYAINRWVEGAILTPNAAQRPAWGSDPHYSMFFHLKQFSYSFHQTILKRAVKEMNHGNLAPMGAFVWYIPTMIAADITKGLIQGGGELPAYMKGYDAGDWVMHGVQRAGLLGAAQLGVDAQGDMFSLAGPGVEQAIDAIREPLSETTIKALPVHGLYAQALR